MAHFKCRRCRLRLSGSAGPEDLIGDLCPGCGSLLEPVSDLSEIVGFRAIRRSAEPTSGTMTNGHRRLAARVRELRGREEAREAQARLDAERWLDDGGSFSPDTVAQAVALPKPGWTP